MLKNGNRYSDVRE